MGRIEDQEAERTERVLQERKLAEKQLRTKQLAEHEQFQNFVRKAADTKQHDMQHDQQKGELNQDARRALLARRGIDSNQAQSRIFGDGQADNAQTRNRLLKNQADKQKLNDQLQAGHKDNQSSTKSTSMGVGRGGDKQKDSDAQGRPTTKRKEGEGGAGAAAANSFAAIGHAAVEALDGMGARAGGSKGVEQADQVRKMLEEIVKSVRQGVDQNGYGLMQITLNDDVLGGTSLTVLSSQAGIHLKVDTGETGTRRSDRPIESLLTSSATELAHAMQAAKVPLIGLEVNGDKVIA